MDIFQAIKARYSHKERFLPTPIPQEDLAKIIEAGLTSPSGSNAQSVHLIVLPDRDSIQPLFEVARHPGLETAPTVIALLTDCSKQQPYPNFELQDYSAACQNILLAATSLGYSSLWLDYMFFDREIQKAACKLFKAPENFTLQVVIPIGLPDGPGSRREKRPISERLHYKHMG